MHVESTIELLKSIKKDIEHYMKNYNFGRVFVDLKESIFNIDKTIYSLKWAEKHLKELEQD